MEDQETNFIIMTTMILAELDCPIGGVFWKETIIRWEQNQEKKCAVDRANWSSYLNFRDMYLHIKDILLNDSKMAVKLPVPIWVDRDGNEVDC